MADTAAAVSKPERATQPTGPPRFPFTVPGIPESQERPRAPAYLLEPDQPYLALLLVQPTTQHLCGMARR